MQGNAQPRLLSSSMKYSFMSSSAPSILLATNEEPSRDEIQPPQHQLKPKSQFCYEMKTGAFNSGVNLSEIVVSVDQPAIWLKNETHAAENVATVSVDHKLDIDKVKREEFEEREIEELAKEIRTLKKNKYNTDDSDEDNNDDDVEDDNKETFEDQTSANVLNSKAYFDLLLVTEEHKRIKKTEPQVFDEHIFVKQLVNEEQLKQAFIKNVRFAIS